MPNFEFYNRLKHLFILFNLLSTKPRQSLSNDFERLIIYRCDLVCNFFLIAYSILKHEKSNTDHRHNSRNLNLGTCLSHASQSTAYLILTSISARKLSSILISTFYRIVYPNTSVYPFYVI